MQNSSTEEEIKRLLELKQIPESSRTNKQQVEMNKLQEQHKAYARLNASEMTKNLQNKPGARALAIDSPDSAAITQDYMSKFANTPGYQKPSPKPGIKTLTFSNDQDAASFLQSQASKGQKFRVMDAQHRVLAVSNGKGLLQHADGRPFNSGGAIAALANTGSTNNINTMLNQNQPLAQRASPRPNMTAPPSTAAMKLQATRPYAKPSVSAIKQPTNIAPTSKPMEQARPLNAQKNPSPASTPYKTPTPYKKSPYEQ